MKGYLHVFVLLLFVGALNALQTPAVPSLPAGLPPAGALKPVTSPLHPDSLPLRPDTNR